VLFAIEGIVQLLSINRVIELDSLNWLLETSVAKRRCTGSCDGALEVLAPSLYSKIPRNFVVISPKKHGRPQIKFPI